MQSSPSGCRPASSFMNTQPDFEDFLRLLEVHRVDYMIVGGYAVAYHGFPRFTKDIDVFFCDASDNLVRLQAALVDFACTLVDALAELVTIFVWAADIEA